MYCPQSVDPPMRRLNGRETTVTLKLAKCIHPSFSFFLSLSPTHTQATPRGRRKRKHISKHSCLSHRCARTQTHTLSGKSERERLHKICVFPRCSCRSSMRISHLSLILDQIRDGSQSANWRSGSVLLSFLWPIANTCGDSRPPLSVSVSRRQHTHTGPFSSCCSVISPWHPLPPSSSSSSHPFSSFCPPSRYPFSCFFFSFF